MVKPLWEICVVLWVNGVVIGTECWQQKIKRKLHTTQITRRASQTTINLLPLYFSSPTSRDHYFSSSTSPALIFREENVWHAIDTKTRQVLAYVFGRRKDFVCRQLQELLNRFGINRYCTDGWGADQRHLPAEVHEVGKPKTQKISPKIKASPLWEIVNHYVYIVVLLGLALIYGNV